MNDKKPGRPRLGFFAIGGRLASAFVIIGLAALAGATAGLIAVRQLTRPEPAAA